MAEDRATLISGRDKAILALECFQVAFLLLHDWIPLGRLNNLEAQRSTDSLRRLLTTLLSALPYVLGLILSARASPWAAWVRTYLLVSYGVLFLGELRAWWVPYFLVPDPVRAERYRRLFGGTHAILPERNGIVPNTLHTVLHGMTLTTLLLLWLA